MAATLRPARPQSRVAPWAVVALVGVPLGLADWYLLRSAWLAEDAGPRFAVMMEYVFFGVGRITVAIIAGLALRNAGLVLGIAATTTTFFGWKARIRSLPGTTVVDADQGSFLIPLWSLAPIMGWTLALIGFGTALLWSGQRWWIRLLAAAPFSALITFLLQRYEPFV